MRDDELPGAWSHADFEGGDPDERSYAQRERDFWVTHVERRYCPGGTNLTPTHRIDRESGACRGCGKSVEQLALAGQPTDG